jgi:hypothetical protein
MPKYYRILSCFILSSALLIPTISSALTNGNFETGDFTGWNTYSGGFSVISGNRTGGSGTKIAYVYNGNPQPATLTQTASEIFANGNTWRLTGWFRVSSGSSGIDFGFIGSQSPFGPSSDNIVIPSTATTWTVYTVNHSWNTEDYSDGYRDVQLKISGYPESINADDISLQNLSDPTGFVNGDFELGGGSFTGWTGYGVYSIVSGARSGGSGTHVAYIYNAIPPPGSIRQTVSGITTNGNVWRLIGWLRAGAGNNTPVDFGFFGSTSPYGASSTNASVPTSATSWAAYTVNHFWTSANTADGYRDVGVTVSGTGPDSVTVDDITLQNTTVPIMDWCFY